MFIGSKAPIMSAKGGMKMDQFLESLYNDHFSDRANSKLGETVEYKKRSEHQQQIIRQIYRSLIKDLPDEQAIGLLNDLNDAMFHLEALYQFEDFKYSFLTGIQLGIKVAQIKQTDLTAEHIMQLLYHLKEDNS